MTEEVGHMGGHFYIDLWREYCIFCDELVPKTTGTQIITTIEEHIKRHDDFYFFQG